MDEMGEVKEPPPFEKVAEDWRNMGEPARSHTSAAALPPMAMCCSWCACALVRCPAVFFLLRYLLAAPLVCAPLLLPLLQ